MEEARREAAKRQWQAAQFAEAAADTEADIDTAGLLGLKHAGLKALSSLRLEKGYRDYGHDMVRVRMSECVCASMLVCTCACGALSTARQPTAARWPKLLQGRAASRAAHGCLPAVAMSTIDVEEIAVREQLCSAALCPNGRLCSHRISTYCCHPVPLLKMRQDHAASKGGISLHGYGSCLTRRTRMATVTWMQTKLRPCYCRWVRS